eukprot:g2467.t1
MAAATRRGVKATYDVHDNYEVDTQDHEDHTFSGIMFEVMTKSDFPVDHLKIESVWVRGALGPMAVYYTRERINDVHETPRAWTKVYEADHEPSMRSFVELKLEEPVILKPGSLCGLYVHSRRQDDDAIVYDNQNADITKEDNFMQILSGVAHLSHEPFGGVAPWGGYPWRTNRQFVGRISYGTRYLLWNPEIHDQFPNRFRRCSSELLIRHATSWSGLPSAIIMYILNMLPFDWFESESRARNYSMDGRSSRSSSAGSSRYFFRRRTSSGLRGMTRLLNHFVSIARRGHAVEIDDEDDDDDYLLEEEEEEDDDDEDDNRERNHTAHAPFDRQRIERGLPREALRHILRAMTSDGDSEDGDMAIDAQDDSDYSLSAEDDE